MPKLDGGNLFDVELDVESKTKLDWFMNDRGLDPILGPIYLSEIKLDQNPVNDRARRQLLLLGLVHKHELARLPEY